MREEYSEQVLAEMAVTELRRAWIDVLAKWRGVEDDPDLMADIRDIAQGLRLKLDMPKKEAA
jgi:hypothetical protein